MLLPAPGLLAYVTGGIPYILVMLDGVLAASPAPREIPFNGTRALGPDGPWQIITLSTGTPPQNVDFYPVIDANVSWFVAEDSCNDQELTCLQPEIGYYDRYG